MRLRKTRNETTVYSPLIGGDTYNHGQSVRFDLTGSYLGINQSDDSDDGSSVDRVLLTPNQLCELIKFVTVKHATR